MGGMVALLLKFIQLQSVVLLDIKELLLDILN